MGVLWFTAAFAATVCFILLLRPVAARYGLVDHPGGRKIHDGPVPRIGGLAMFGGVLFTTFLFSFPLPHFLLFIAVPTFVVLIGLWDDSRGLSPRQKLTLQILAVVCTILLHGIVIYDLGAVFGANTTSLGWWAVPFTVFAVVGMMNAMNMIDGMDGLAGGLAFVALVLLAVVAAMAGRTAYVPILFVLVTSVAAFLCFNLRFSPDRPARVFLGDAGSLFLGFVLAWFSIGLSQGPTRAMTPVTALWILAVPLFDTVSLMLRRVVQGRSPFHADRRHLQHLLQDLGYSVNQTLCIILGLALALGLVGIGGYYAQTPEALLFYTIMALFGVYFAVTHYLGRVLAARKAGLGADARPGFVTGGTDGGYPASGLTVDSGGMSHLSGARIQAVLPPELTAGATGPEQTNPVLMLGNAHHKVTRSRRREIRRQSM